ncbi:hypothetical protein KIPB_001700, partial [Kipferlia bialata]|eukprot:g1700.t1
MLVIECNYTYLYSDDGPQPGSCREYARNEAEAIPIILKMLLDLEADYKMNYQWLDYQWNNDIDDYPEIMDEEERERFKRHEGVETLEQLM